MTFDFTDWMGLLPGSKKLSEFSIPGTHDSGSTIQESIPVYQSGFFTDTARVRLFTQTRGLKEQLEGGIRFLDIRCAYIVVTDPVTKAVTSSHFEVQHEQYSLNLTFDRVLQICKQFLGDHPSETIVMSLKQEQTKDQNGFAKRFQDYVDLDPDLWFLGNEIPFLSTVRGKIVLFRRFARAAGETREVGIDAAGKDPPNNTDRFPDNGTSTAPTLPPKLYIQDDFGIVSSGIDNKVKVVKETLTKAAESSDRDVLYVNFTSAAGIKVKDYPINAAAYVNPEVQDYLQAPQKHGRFGVLLRDFEAIEVGALMPQALAPVNQLIIQTNLDYYSLRQGGLAVDFGDGLDSTLLLAEQASDAAGQLLAFAPSEHPPYLYIESTRTNKVIQVQSAPGSPLVAFRKVRGRDSQLWKLEPSGNTGSFFITSKLAGAGSITNLGPAPRREASRLGTVVRGRGFVPVESQLWSVVKSS